MGIENNDQFMKFISELLEEMKEMRHTNENMLAKINTVEMRINEIEVLNEERMRVFTERRMVLYWTISSLIVLFSGIWRYIVQAIHKSFQ